MLNWLSGKSKGGIKEFKVLKMHCVSCAMNIDIELEELPGVLSSHTSYAKGETKLEFDTKKIDFRKVKKVVEDLGYEIKE